MMRDAAMPRATPNSCSASMVKMLPKMKSVPNEIVNLKWLPAMPRAISAARMRAPFRPRKSGGQGVTASWEMSMDSACGSSTPPEGFREFVGCDGSIGTPEYSVDHPFIGNLVPRCYL